MARSDNAFLPSIKWKVELDERLQPDRVLPDGRLLLSRGSSAMLIFSADGRQELALPPPLGRGEEWRNWAVAANGTVYTLISKTEFWHPGDPLYEFAARGPAGEALWSTMLMPQAGAEAAIYPLGAKVYMVSRELLTCFDRQGQELWQSAHEEPLGEPVIVNGALRFYACDHSSVNCFDERCERLWSYSASGVRREFIADQFGSCYAMLKAPERLIKIDPDGALAWSFNLTDHAASEYNSFFDYGYTFGRYIDVSVDGTVHFVDCYNSLSALTSSGKHCWTVADPRRSTPRGDDRVTCLDHPNHPRVGPDGTVFFTSGDCLCAVDRAGDVLFVDDRFAELSAAPLVGPDGTVYVTSGEWLYALDPRGPAAADELAEQAELRRLEEQRRAELEAEWEAERLAIERARDIQGVRDGKHNVRGERQPAEPPGPELCDRTQVAAIIIAALNDYYAEHGEYAPYLIGAKSTDDPLIAGRDLEAYPLVYPQPGCWCCMPSIGVDERQYVRWACAVSTPGAPNDRPAPDCVRGLILGGVSTGPAGAPRYAFGGSTIDHAGNSQLNYFGYQRGEWLRGDARTAWLWLYGSNIWPEQNTRLRQDRGNERAREYYDLFDDFAYGFGGRGLDLLNAGTGELAPDGILDGICLLYKLEQGRLVSTVRAEGI